MNETDEWLTVAEAASQLGTTVPRLRRVLARPEYRERTREQERKTRTGTRTATVVSVSVLPDLQRSLSSEPVRNRNENDSQPEREREQVGRAPSDDRAALIEHLEAEIAFLRSSLEAASVERSELRRLLLVEQDAVKRLTPGPLQDAPASEPVPQAAHAGAVGDLEQNAANNARKTQEAPETQKRGFWTKVWDAILYRG